MDSKYCIGKPRILNKDLFLKRIEDILFTGKFSNNGPYVEEMENYFSQYYGARFVIALNNATSALDVALAYLKTKVPFGQVVTPSFTFVSAVHSIVRAGFEPVFCDINDDFTYNRESIDLRINKDTAGLLIPNLFGNLADFDYIEQKYKGLFTISDSAHALGVYSQDLDRSVGQFGDCEVISHHPTKMAGAFEGGLLCTYDKDLYDFAMQYRNFGYDHTSVHPQGHLASIGTNFKMNEIQAAAILCQLESLEDIHAHYFNNWQTYKASLPEQVKLTEPNEYFSNFSYVICRVDSRLRDKLVDWLIDNSIHARTYFQPIHKMEPYKEKYGHIQLPNTERLSSEVLALPTGLAVEDRDIVKICNVIKEFFNE